MSSKTWNVFISYSSKDKAIASVIVDDLREQGFTVWQDELTIQPGMKLREAIHEGIQKSSCILVIFSNNSLNSNWVVNELDGAMLREIREGRSLVLPVLIGKIDPNALPFDLEGRKYIDLRHNFPKNYQQNKQYLINAVRLASFTSDSSVLSDTVTMSNEYVAMLLTKKFPPTYEQLVHSSFISGLMDIMFESETMWGEGMEEGIGFLDKYGDEAAKRLFVFSFQDAGVDVMTKGFTEEEFQSVITVAGLKMWLVMSHERFVEDFGEEIVGGTRKDGKFGFVLRKINT